MMRISGGSRCAALIGLLGVSVGLSVFGCSAADSTPAPEAVDNLGAIGLALQAGGLTLSNVIYTIVGPAGFSKLGTIDVSASTQISTVIGGLPAGNGYSITLNASDAGTSGATCTGSASFNVAAGATTTTLVRLQCRAPGKTGSVMVNGTLNLCPTIDSLSVAPAETTVGHSVALVASASDTDQQPSALSYTWTTTGGTLTGATSATASLSCTSAGQVTVTLNVTDGDCSDALTQVVTCSPAPSGGAGGAGGSSSGGAGGVSGAGAGAGGGGAGAAGAAGGGLIKINEVESNGGTPDDWVELFNAGSAPIDISGYIFKDNDDTHSYTLPSGSVVLPGAYLVLDTGGSGFNFGLGAADSARLYLPNGTTIVDTYSWSAHAATTYGRCPNGIGDFATTLSSTKGTANVCSTGSGGSGGAGGGGGSGGANAGAGGGSGGASAGSAGAGAGGSGGAAAGAGGGGASAGGSGGVSAFATWPGGNDVQTVDVAASFTSNLSGLFYEPAQGTTPPVLWAAMNGPSKIYRLINDGTNWVPDSANGWGAGKTLHYSTGIGSPDSEGITRAAAGTTALYVSSERDNDSNSVSRLGIHLYDDTGNTSSTLNAARDWFLTSDIPATGANLGLEAIAWIPDTFLMSKGFIDESKGTPYDPTNYPNHAGGIFFVGVEESGLIYGYALDHAGGGFTRVATFASGNPAIMDLNFDREVGYLWADCDDSCQGRLNVLDIDTRPGSPTLGKFYVRQGFERPSTMPNTNNEGFTVTPESLCVGGKKPVFWSDDNDQNQHAIRRDSIPCGAFLL